MNTAELLQELYNTRSPNFTKSDYWDDKLKRKGDYSFGGRIERVPLSFEDFTAWKALFQKDLNSYLQIYTTKKLRLETILK